MRKKISLVALTLMLIFSMAAAANAAITASDYIGAANANAERPSGSQVKVSFQITGIGTMDKIGAKTIIIQEQAPNSSQWNAVATFNSDSYPSMLRNNSTQHFSSVSYNSAKANCSYRAKVYFYAEKGGYDVRELITASV